MSRRCRGCGRPLYRPSPDGYGPVCSARLVARTHNPATPRVPVAPAAGQLELEEPMTADRTQTLHYTDYDGDQLTIASVPDASSYAGPIPVVSLEIVDSSDDEDQDPAVVYVRLEDVDRLIEAVRKARDEAQSADRVVAYRNSDRPGVLLCRKHGVGWIGLTSLTSEDLPDGGICTWHDCGVDVLAESERTPCSLVPCEDGGEPCERHEREQAHADGEHELCGDECPAVTALRHADAFARMYE